MSCKTEVRGPEEVGREKWGSLFKHLRSGFKESGEKGKDGNLKKKERTYLKSGDVKVKEKLLNSSDRHSNHEVVKNKKYGEMQQRHEKKCGALSPHLEEDIE